MADKTPETDREFCNRKHPEWDYHRMRWRWLLDSLEGGQRYRDAVYGTDDRGQYVYNLVRHKREYPNPSDEKEAARLGFGQGSVPLAGSGAGGIGPDPTYRSTDDDFELRRARTPIPSFVADAIAEHLGTVYSKEIVRKGIDGPEFTRLRDWMEDVDGRGTRYDDWIRETFAPLFLDLGQIDLYFDHPRKPDNEEVATAADVARLKLDRCIVRYILPEAITWWDLDPVTNLYTEVCAWECMDPDDAGSGDLCWHWTADEFQASDKNGETNVAPTTHPFGFVPIVRLFDRRKFRYRNVGQSRYESIADRMKEYYNRDSELILSDTTQAHPLLQGPEDYVQADGTLPVGPNWLLPKKKNTQGGSVSYEGFDVVVFPKDGAESIRRNKGDIRDEVDRAAFLAKPAGSAETGKDSVRQSGISKVMDSQGANRFIASIAGSLARCERTILEYALRCLFDKPDVSDLMAKVEVVYPTDYDLQSAQDLGTFIADFMDLLEQSGNCPEAEILALTRYYRAALPGLDDDTYAEIEAEIREFVEKKAADREQRAEMAPQALPGQPVPPGLIPASPDDDDLVVAGADPTQAD